MIKFQQVTKKYGDKEALSKVSFDIEKGEFVFVVGSTGAGKTTILKLLLGEIKPDGGRIAFDNLEVNSLKARQLPYLRRRIGTVFQDFKLLRDRTVWENTALAADVLRGDKDLAGKDIEEALKKVDMIDKKDLFPLQLSGGELQKTVIARAVVFQPDLIFADEPTGNLDPATAWQIINLLVDIHQKSKTTVIVATHNCDIVDSMKKRVIEIENGKIVRDQRRGKYKK